MYEEMLQESEYLDFYYEEYEYDDYNDVDYGYDYY